MKKEELAKQYADKKTAESPLNAYNNYPLERQKELCTFDGYDIEQAYEDGYDKAVELAREWLEEIFGAYQNKDNVIEIFRKKMEEGV